MSNSYEVYGATARYTGSYTELAGRYGSQESAETRIPIDVAAKLELAKSDRLLEIGCGAGGLLIPLSAHVSDGTGVDHPNLLDLMSQRAGYSNIHAVPGNFLDVELDGPFDKILIYSVLHCLEDLDQLHRFMDKALALLKPGGRMLLGDIPNRDLKKRFLASESGKQFEAAWRQAMETSGEISSDAHQFLAENAATLRTLSFDDNSIAHLVSWLRGRGTNAYWVRQPVDLPFGHTREDVVVLKPD